MNLVDVFFELDEQLASLALYTEKQYNKGRIREYQTKILNSLMLEHEGCLKICIYRNQETWELPRPCPRMYVVKLPESHALAQHVPVIDPRGFLVFPRPVNGILLHT